MIIDEIIEKNNKPQRGDMIIDEIIQKEITDPEGVIRL